MRWRKRACVPVAASPGVRNRITRRTGRPSGACQSMPSASRANTARGSLSPGTRACGTATPSPTDAGTAFSRRWTASAATAGSTPSKPAHASGGHHRARARRDRTRPGRAGSRSGWSRSWSEIVGDGLELVADVADQLLDDVLEREHPDLVAPRVGHEAHVLARLLELAHAPPRAAGPRTRAGSLMTSRSTSGVRPASRSTRIVLTWMKPRIWPFGPSRSG